MTAAIRRQSPAHQPAHERYGGLSTNDASQGSLRLSLCKVAQKDANKVAQTREMCYDFVYYFTKVTQVVC